MQASAGVIEALILGVLATAALVIFVGWFISEPGYRGPVSDHFDGQRFYNDVETPLPSPMDALRILRKDGLPAPWKWRDHPACEAPPTRVAEGIRATFVNHATVLVQHDSVNILTDPVWSKRASSVSFFGPKRYVDPGVSIDDLPVIDLVIVSHNHYDHLDAASLRVLAERDDPTVVVPLGNGEIVRRQGFSRVIELDWGASVEVLGLVVVGQRVRHFANRGTFDRQRSLWMGTVVKGPSGSWYFAGDTGFGPHFEATGEAHGPFELALIPIGAYSPASHMAPIHMDPGDAVRAHRLLRSKQSLAIHFGTFRLTLEPQDEPVEWLERALVEQEVEPESFVALEPGQALVTATR